MIPKMNKPLLMIRNFFDFLFGCAGLVAFGYLFIFRLNFIENNFFVNIATNITNALNWLGWSTTLTSVQYALASVAMAGLCLFGVSLQMFFTKILDLVFPSTQEKAVS